MNKQEVIEKIENLGTLKINDTVLHQQIDMIVKNNVLDIISQIHEPEKQVVPQFVADYIDSEQKSCSTLSEALGNMYYKQRIADWFYINSETFAKAWLYGYEVEKEKLYTVEIPNPRSTLHFVLCKYEEGEVRITYYNSDNWRDYKCVQLTESEIKQDFEWAWKFRKEV